MHQTNQTVKGVAAAFYSQLLKHPVAPQPLAAEFQIFESPYSVSTPNFAFVYNFIYRLFKKAQIEPECLIAAVEYCDEFQRRTSCLLTDKTFVRLAFVSIQVASKVWDDVSCSSKSFAMCSTDFTLKELNAMERTFCQILNFELFLEASDYRDYYYDAKKLWLSLLTSEDMQIVGWTDASVNQEALQSNWPEWGVAGLKSLVLSGDIKQVKAV